MREIDFLQIHSIFEITRKLTSETNKTSVFQAVSPSLLA